MIGKSAFYAVNNIFCILILLVISFHFSKRSLDGSISNRLFMAMLIQTIILLVVDFIGSFEGTRSVIYIIFCRVGNFMLYALNPIIIFIWNFYVDYYLYRDIKRLKKLAVPLILVYTVQFTLVIISQFNGLLYFVDQNNIYHRGPFFFFEVVLTSGLILFSYIEIIMNRHKLIKRHFYSFMIFAVPPLLGMALQVIFYGLTIILNGIVLSLLVIFIMIQNEYIQTDFLTGLYNRYKLEQHLKEKIRNIGSGRFAVVMLDLNAFKSINDTYGHKMGDKALKLVANALKESLKKDDFIARYGGDEFIIIYDDIDQEQLGKNIGALGESLKKINNLKILPCGLSFSIGSAIFDGNSVMNMDDLLQLIDCKLYEDKRKNQI